MKKLGLVILMAALANCSYGQFKILSNYTAEMTNGRLTFKTSNPGIEFGANDGQGTYQSTISFYHSISKWNILKAYSYIVMSDANLKTNLAPIENASEVLSNINTYSYSMVENPEITSYGVIAQELESILPGLVDTTHGVRGVNYIGLIPFLIRGFQEKSEDLEDLRSEYLLLKEENDRLQEQVEELINMLNGESGNSNPKSKHNTKGESSKYPVLYQNSPNPFTQDTKIHYYLPETCGKAALVIYDLQGRELQSYPLTQKGEQDFLIQGSKFVAGMYVYALIVDNQIIDTKRMTLTK
jgi:hypothetical protein